MENKQAFIPIAIGAVVAIACTTVLFATDFGGPPRSKGLTMITASIVDKAGATVTPTLPATR
jgi:hypothetical protein